MYETLILSDHQIDHYETNKKILEYSTSILNTSPFGRGKTYIAIKYALDHYLKMVVVCDKTMQNKINDCAQKYGARDVEILTYSGLRGNSDGSGNITIKHDMLEYRDGKYVTTEALEKRILDNTLFVFDEAQALKNDSYQYKSALAIVKKVQEVVVASKKKKPSVKSNKSRIMYLSKTPFADPDNIVNFVNLLCLTKHEELVKDGKPTGYSDILRLSNAIDPDKTRFYLNCNVDDKMAKNIVYKLYTTVFKYYYSCEMPKMELKYEKDAKNCYYNICDNQAKPLSRKLDILGKEIVYNPDGSAKFVSAKEGRGKKKNKISILRDIELLKVPLFARLCEETLEKDDKCKVIVSFNYLNSIERLSKTLEERGIKTAVITGGTPTEAIDKKNKGSGNKSPGNKSPGNKSPNKETRESIIKRFQEDPTCRLLITSRVCRSGIDLDDKTGEHPRILYINPSFNYIDICQMTGRIYRTGTRSKATIRIVYCYNKKYQEAMMQELRILQSLSRKNGVTKDISTEEQNEENIFDSEPIYEEGIDMDVVEQLTDNIIA